MNVTAARKTFTKAMQDEVTQEWTDAKLRGRNALVKVQHGWKCPDCNVLNPLKKTNCKGRRGEPCGAEFENSTCKIFPQIEPWEIYPLDSGEGGKQAPTNESKEDDLLF